MTPASGLPVAASTTCPFTVFVLSWAASDAEARSMANDIIYFFIAIKV
jgi:hypothetical protein